MEGMCIGSRSWGTHPASLEASLIKVWAGQEVRYAVIKGGVRRRHPEALMYSELTVTDLHMGVGGARTGPVVQKGLL